MTTMRSVDVDAIARDVPYDLVPWFLQLRSQIPSGGDLPVPAPLPELDDGPHLSYAFQWFAFATIAAVGYVILIRRDAQGPPADDVGPGTEHRSGRVRPSVPRTVLGHCFVAASTLIVDVAHAALDPACDTRDEHYMAGWAQALGRHVEVFAEGQGRDLGGGSRKATASRMWVSQRSRSSPPIAKGTCRMRSRGCPRSSL